jgi:hypothetical protein
MATYIYETIPEQDGQIPRRFEVVQSMKEAPLARHPETGELVKRVITGGFGIMGASERRAAPTSVPAAACRPGCACHSGPRIPQP